jgi:hypothetical protein
MNFPQNLLVAPTVGGVKPQPLFGIQEPLDAAGRQFVRRGQ